MPAAAEAQGTVTISASFGGQIASTSLTVTSATLIAIDVAPADPTIANGTSFQFTATGVFSDLTTQDLTKEATWSSADTAIATVSNAPGSQGRATGLAVGASTIAADFGGLSDTTVLTVTAATLVAINVDPTDPSIANGFGVQFSATGIFSDLTSQDLTSLVTWFSSDAAVATVSNAAGSEGLATTLAVGTTTVSAFLNGQTGSTSLTVTNATLASIDLSPLDPSIAGGQTVQFSATGIFSDSTVLDLTSQATWLSTDAAIATVSNAAGSRGLATGTGKGSATIQAVLAGITGSTGITVTSATLDLIEVTPAVPSIANGTSIQLAATGILSDGTKQDLTSLASWSSSLPGVATVSNGAGSQGLVSSASVGSTTISATFLGKTGATSVTVTGAVLTSIEVSPVAPSLAAGTTAQLTATGIFSDGTHQDLTTQAAWSSSDDLIATVSNAAGSQGLATAVATGTATMTAAFGGQTGSTALTVTGAVLASIEVTPAAPSLANGTTLQFTATGIFTDATNQDLTTLVVWSSSAASTAAVSNAAGSHGLATALAVGSATISATLGGITGSTDLNVTAATLVAIDVTPAAPTLAAGMQFPFAATGAFSDGTKQDLTAQAIWSSSSGSVAVISNAAGSAGLALALAAGSTTVSAAFSGITGSTSLTVTNATLDLVLIEVTPAAPSIAVGRTIQFNVTGIFSDGTAQDLTIQVTWSSSNPAVAAVSNAPGSQGLATALAAGSVTVSATLAGVTGTAQLTVTNATLDLIQVTPAAPSMAAGTALPFAANGTFSDGSHQDLTAQVTWSSSAASVAVVSNAAGSEGLATGLTAGSATVSATLAGITGTTLLTVTGATLVEVQITPSFPSVADGTTLQFHATGLFSDSTVQDLTAQATWSSADGAVAAVSNGAGSEGLATALGTGTTVIAATFGGLIGSTDLTVTSATVVTIEVTPTAPSQALGTTLQFTATGVFSDSTIQDLTGQVAWTSSATSIAVVSNADGARGLATGLAVGTATISATLAGITGSTDLTITAATLVSIEIAPVDTDLALGTTLQYSATGVFSDATTHDLTSQVTWLSSFPSAVVSNSAGSEGLATAVGLGTTTVSAVYLGVTGTATLNVTNATLSLLQIAPADPSIAKGAALQFTATGVFSDASTQDLTTQVAWLTSDPAVAYISNAADSSGLATGIGTGTTTILAVLSGKTRSTTITVTTLERIEVTPAVPSIANGTKIQFVATGILSDFTKQDFTALVTWSSSNGGVAAISNDAGSEGLASAAGVGSSTIAATFAGLTGSTTLSVTGATLDAIEVTPANLTVPQGPTIPLTAMGIFSDGTKQDLTAQAVWDSSDDLVASVSNDAGSVGIATAVGTGTAVLSASFAGVSGSTNLTVDGAIDLLAIEVTPVDPSLAIGTTLQLAATAILSDGSSLDITHLVTWTSSDFLIVRVSNAGGNRGLAGALAPGVATISASVAGVTGTVDVTATSATLDSIDVTPAAPSLADGFKLQFNATGTFSDGTKQDLTEQVIWGSSDGAVAVISNASGSEGLATALAPGSTTVSAIFSGVTGSTSLSVTNATLDSIQITPSNPSFPNRTQPQFTATGVFSDATSQDLTVQVTWFTSAPAVASISNAPGSEGRAKTLSAGSGTISARLVGVTGSTPFTVTDPTLVSIQVTPSAPSMADGTSLQMTATGIFDDGTSQDLTAQVTWASSDSAVAAVSNAAGSRGLAVALNLGSATVSATLAGITGSTLVTVTNATLQSIEITPVDQTIADGTSLQYTATGVFTDGSTQDLTAQVAWASSDLAVASVSSAAGSEGLATALDPGSATVSATLLAITGSTSLTVTNATLDLIEITPPAPSLAKGTTLQFVATGVFSDGSTADLTTQASWISSAPAAATVSNAAGSQGLAAAVEIGSATVSAAFGGVTGSTVLTVTGATLASIEITPTAPSLADGKTVQLTATGIFTDGTNQNLTALVTWTSSDTAAATVSNAGGTEGLATALGAGSATISAQLSGQTGSTVLTVTPATLDAIQVTPAIPTVANGTGIQFVATGIFSDSSTQDLTTQVTWSSSADFVASVSNAAGSHGFAVAASIGNTTVSASLDGKTGSTNLTVTAPTLDSIEVAPATPTIAAGTTLQFTATGTYSDASIQDLTAQVTWSSSATSVATVSNAAGSNGFATAASAGSTTVSAALGGTTGSTVLTVTAATLSSIAVSPADPSISAGTTVAFTATGTYSDASTQDLTTLVTWSTSDAAVATVSNAAGETGLATAVSVGAATIAATLDGTTGTTTLTVTAATLSSIAITPADPVVVKGTHTQFTATGTFSDASTQDLTTQVTWLVSNGAIASVSNAVGSQGFATGVGTGSATVLAVFSGITGSTGITVVDAALASIEVTPAVPSIADGTQLQFAATGILTDGTKQDLTALATWSSSDTGVATVSNAAGNQGRAAGLSVGFTTISATFSGVTGSTDLTVTAATLDLIQVTPTDPSLAAGTSLQLTATGVFSDGTSQDLTDQVTWSTSAAPIATVSNGPGSEGLATGVSAGTATISAALFGQTGSTDVTVTAAVLNLIQVTPTAPSLAAGTSLQLTATGVLSDGNTQDLTDQVIWSSSAPLTAAVSNNPGSKGLVSGVAAGNATVSAALNGVTGSTAVSVTAAVLASIEVDPAAPSIAQGLQFPFAATGVFTDGTKLDITAQVTWSSTDTAVAVISNAAGSEGLATALANGSATISATLSGFIGSTSLTVVNASLLVIQVTPNSPSLPDGTTLQLTASGIFSDSSTQDLTALVTWESSVPAVATVSSGAGSEGLATALAIGSTTVSATLSGVTGSTALTVTNATLSSIEVTPTAPSLAKGRTLQLSAIGIFSDATTEDLTDQVTWSTSVAAVADISNAAGSTGLASAVDVGTTTILATVSGLSGSTNLTVTAATLDAIEVSPSAPSTALGTTVQFTATGIFSDNSSQDLTGQVAWLTSDPTVAAVSSSSATAGQAKGLGLGNATISATLSGVIGGTILTVTPATLDSLEISPLVISMAAGTTLQFTATGIFSDGTSQNLTDQATWSSSAPATATVSNAAGSKGVGSALSPGNVTLQAAFGGVTGSLAFTVSSAALTSIQVTPPFPSTAKGNSLQFTATGIFSDGSNQDVTTQVTWLTSDATVATVSNASGSHGLTYGLDIGSAVISAMLSGVTGSTNLTVTSATLDSIVVTPADPTVPLGADFQFTATGIFSDLTTADLTTQVTWFTSDGAVATVSNAAGSKGLARGMAEGSATILAFTAGKGGATTITVAAPVLDSIEVSPANPSIPRGTTFPLMATGVFTDGTTLDLTSQATWVSSDDLIAPVSNGAGSQGLVLGSDFGTATISAMFDGLTGSTTVTVSTAVLESIEIDPLDDSIANGTQDQFIAVGIFSDASEVDITNLVTWTSSNVSIAVISNVAGAHGLATGHSPGTVTITASLSGISTSTSLIITNATLSSIVLSPLDPVVPKGLTQQFIATGLFSDSTAQDLTNQVTWTTSAGPVATISNAAGSRGRATALTQGVATVLATLAGVSASTTITVTDAILMSVNISPINANLPLPWKREYTATASYSDGTNFDVTTQVVWGTSNPAVATISNAAGAQGTASSVSLGTVQISVTYQGFNSYTNLTVTNESLVSIKITPTTTIVVGQSIQMTATATFSGGTILNVTKQVIWRSMKANTVRVSNTPGSIGVATGLKKGNSNIRVRKGGAGQAKITVI